MPTPEELARQNIDALLTQCDWSTELNNGARGRGATWTLGPQGSRAGRRVINRARGKRCDMDGKPEGSISGNESINRARGKRCKMDGRPGGSMRGSESINVQHLTSNKLDGVCHVTICTIQRLYPMLRSLLFWLKNGSRRANSREETGRALCAFNANDMPWRVGLYSGRIFS